MVQEGFYFDSTRCTGCKTCESACRDYKDNGPDITFRKIYDYEGGTITLNEDNTVEHDVICYHISLGCQHCTNPACADVCPTTAMHKEDEFGVVLVDPEKCIGCGYCVMACPYNVPKVDKDKGYSVKCDGCIERLREGKQTICVESCPLRALDWDDMDQLERKYEGNADILPLPDPLYTDPNLIVKHCPDSQEAEKTRGFVANPLEVV